MEPEDAKSICPSHRHPAAARLSLQMSRSIVSMLAATFVLRVSTSITAGLLVFFVNDLTKNSGGGQAPIAILHGGFYATELTGAIAFGILADRYGRKVIMLLGPLFGSVAVLMTGMTTMLPVLFVTRLLEGSSTAASIPSTLGFIAAETADDEALRGRVVSLFELVSLGGMLAVGPALSGILWDTLGRPAFFLNCGFYMVALVLYAYGVSEVPRDKAADVAARTARPPGGELRRYWRIATSRSVLLFAPTWLAINAVLGLWGNQAPLLLTGNKHDPSQFLMQGASPTAIGIGEARPWPALLGHGLRALPAHHSAARRRCGFRRTDDRHPGHQPFRRSLDRAARPHGRGRPGRAFRPVGRHARRAGSAGRRKRGLS